MKRLTIILILTIISISCKKNTEIEVCSSNCKEVNIKGRIIDAYSDNGIEGLNYQLIFETFRGNPTGFPGPTYPSKLINQGNTSQNGNFTINTTVDSTLFNNYSLLLKTNQIENYFRFNSGYFSENQYSGKDSIKIFYYPTTDLTIKLKKTMPRNYDYINLVYEWKIDKLNYSTYATSPFPYNTVKGINDTTVILKVPIENKVKLSIEKTNASGIVGTTQDSIYIKKSSVNIITINY